MGGWRFGIEHKKHKVTSRPFVVDPLGLMGVGAFLCGDVEFYAGLPPLSENPLHLSLQNGAEGLALIVQRLESKALTQEASEVGPGKAGHFHSVTRLS